MVYQDTDDILLIVLTVTLIAASYYLGVLMGNSKSKSCGGKATAAPVKKAPKVVKKVEEEKDAEVS